MVYHPPPSGKSGEPTDTFLSEFQSYIDQHAITSGKLISVGDFNFHYENKVNRDSGKYHDLLYSLNLDQHVQEPTHEKGHMLDLVIARSNENIIRNVDIFGPCLSDHFPVAFNIPWKKRASTHKHVQLRKLRDIDTQAFAFRMYVNPNASRGTK